MKKKKTKAQKRLAKASRSILIEMDPGLCGGHFRRIVTDIWGAVCNVFDGIKYNNIDLFNLVANICMIGWNITIIYPNTKDSMNYITSEDFLLGDDTDDFRSIIVRNLIRIKNSFCPNDRLFIREVVVSVDDAGELHVEPVFDLSDIEPTEQLDFSELNELLDQEALKKSGDGIPKA